MAAGIAACGWLGSPPSTPLSGEGLIVAGQPGLPCIEVVVNGVPYGLAGPGGMPADSGGVVRDADGRAEFTIGDTIQFSGEITPALADSSCSSSRWLVLSQFHVEPIPSGGQ
jgi:hypothetical protein